uniref:Acetyltransferase (GNAT) family protein n=1 Tax=Mimivirus LCMiAC01 TaxID=2506608 RepID=A0A481Z118_9VIRU|nr:MAG: acetyltransferase (GNAT) family protein [Mimivirus LCMiAC01]
MNNFIIRKAVKDDIPKINKVNREVLSENYDLEFYHELLASQYTSSYVAISEEEIVGYIIGDLEINCRNQIHCHIISIAILENYRKRGIGKKLMEKVEEDQK